MSAAISQYMGTKLAKYRESSEMDDDLERTRWNRLATEKGLDISLLFKEIPRNGPQNTP